MTVINRYTGRRDELAFLDQLTSALPYHLSAVRNVAVLGAGGGSDVLQALYHRAERIDAVELNPQMRTLLCVTQADFAGHLCEQPGVRLHVGDGRSFIARSTARYDLIQISLLDSFAATATGVYGLNESYLYTVEALRGFLDHLGGDGMVAITRWMQLPPRDALKLVATARLALEDLGVSSPQRHIALIRGWRTTTLLVSRAPLNAEQIQSLRNFCATRAFDVVFHPGVMPADTNRYTLLQDNAFADDVAQLLGDGAPQLIERYPFDIRPARDDRPYFFHFFRWRALPDLLAMRHLGGWLFLEWGYLVLVTTLLQSVVIGAALILVPLLAWRGADKVTHWRSRTLLYFGLLGVSFLFIEMAVIQQLVLVFDQPTYAAGAVIGSFLVFAGIGSGLAQRFAQRCRDRGHAPLRIITAIIALLAVAAIGAAPWLHAVMAPWGTVAQGSIALATVAPLALFMGMPFPLGLARVGEKSASLVPWAWGINGCASVVSAVLASLIAVQFGFTVVVFIAALGYLVAASVLERT